MALMSQKCFLKTGEEMKGQSKAVLPLSCAFHSNIFVIRERIT